LEDGEPNADAARERDDFFPLVAVQCRVPGGDRLVAASGGFEHLGEVTVSVTLPQE
jgi:hypothetical protein